DPRRLAEITAALERVLRDVRVAVEDWKAMRHQLDEAGLAILSSANVPLPPGDIAEAADFLTWLADDHFTYLGYREYRFGAADRTESGLDIVPASGLGVLRDESYLVCDGLRHFDRLPPDVQEYLRRPRVLLIAKTTQRATVHRATHMDAIGIRVFDAAGRAVGERLFVGLFTSLAYGRSP